MELYIDFRKVTEKANLAQAIKVFAMTYKDCNLIVIVDDDKSTLVEENNIKIIKEYNEKDIHYLFTVDENFVNDELMHLTFLRPSEKQIDPVCLGDLNHNSLSLEDKYSLLNKYHFINKDRPFGILSTSVGNNEEYESFINNHKNEENFIGKVMPKDIVPTGVNNVLGTSDVTNIFIDSLFYTIEFLKLKKDESEESSYNFFSKLLKWDKDDTPKNVTINHILCDYDLYLNEDKFIFITKDNMNYNYYYGALNNFYKLSQR